MKAVRWIAAWLGLVVMSPVSAWTVVDLGTLPDHRYSVATSINSAGTIVGISGGTYLPNVDTPPRGFIWHPTTGSMTELGSLGGNYTIINAIDDLGHIAGTSTTALIPPGSQPYRAILSTPNGGSIASLGPFESKATWATGITPGGSRRVIGYSKTLSGYASSGWISAPQGGPLSKLPVPAGATVCTPYAINDAGRVVGECDCLSTCRGYVHHVSGLPNGLFPGPFLLKNSASSPPAAGAYGVNAAGVIVGWRQVASGAPMPAKWTHFSAEPIALPLPQGAIGGRAYGINSAGRIVGYFTPVSGQTAGVLWQPDGSVTVLDDLPAVKAAGFHDLQIFDINDSGWMVGLGIKSGSSSWRAILIKP